MRLDKNKFKPRFGDWWEYIEPIFDTNIMENIYGKLKELSNSGRVICPDSENTFKTFLTVSPKDLHSVWVLLDPYATLYKGNKIATGIAMDCSISGVIQPSLQKFYDAIEHSEANGMKLDWVQSPSLEYYYAQGIMFLNTALTVEYQQTGGHVEMWKPFMEWLYTEVFTKHFNDLIFVMCGKESQKYEKYLNPLQHRIFKLEHPSAAARNMRPWNYDNIFKKTNTLLKEKGKCVYWIDDVPF